jgi:hypothetical protein
MNGNISLYHNDKSAGGLGSVSGTVSGNIGIITITVTSPGCSGSFAATGTVNTAVTPQQWHFLITGLRTLRRAVEMKVGQET